MVVWITLHEIAYNNELLFVHRRIEDAIQAAEQHKNNSNNTLQLIWSGNDVFMYQEFDSKSDPVSIFRIQAYECGMGY